MPSITEGLLRRVRPRSRKFEISCSSLRGFVLRVLPSGRMAYYVRYRHDGVDTRERLGRVGELSLAQARALAQARLLGLSDAEPGADEPPAPVPAPAPAPAPQARVKRSPRAPTVREFSRRYLEQHVDVRLKPGTREKYRGHLKNLLAAFADTPLDQLDGERVERWHGSLRDRPNAANNALRVLSHMFTKAIEWQVLPRDHHKPTTYVRLYRERRCERFLTPAERGRLEAVLREGEAIPTGRRDAISPSIAAAIRLLALTGMRRSEVLSLDWSMVDFRHRCLRLPDSKTGRRVVPIGSPVLAILGELREQRTGHSPIVLLSQRGTRIQPASLTRAWGMIRKRAGLHDVRLHDLRHSAASDAIMNGVPLAVVGKILGHAQPSTTARYAHIADDVLARAVETMSVSIASCTPEAVLEGKRRRRKPA